MLEDAGFRRTLRLRGRNLKNLRTDVSFKATVNRIGEFALESALGNDPRADAVMELLASGAPLFVSQDRIQDVDSNERWVVVKIRFDKPVYAKKYELRQIVDGLDT